MLIEPEVLGEVDVPGVTILNGWKMRLSAWKSGPNVVSL